MILHIEQLVSISNMKCEICQGSSSSSSSSASASSSSSSSYVCDSCPTPPPPILSELICATCFTCDGVDNTDLRLLPPCICTKQIAVPNTKKRWEKDWGSKQVYTVEKDSDSDEKSNKSKSNSSSSSSSSSHISYQSRRFKGCLMCVECLLALKNSSLTAHTSGDGDVRNFSGLFSCPQCKKKVS